MGMKPKPNRHDRRGYNQSPGNVWRELDDKAQESPKKDPGTVQYPNGTVNSRTLGQTVDTQKPTPTVRKTAVPKVFTTSDIEYSVIKALTPVLQARDGKVFSFEDWTIAWDGNGVVLVLPNGQEFWLSISEAM